MMNAGGKRTFRDDQEQAVPKKARAAEKAPFRLTQLQGDPVQSRRTNDEIHSSIDLGPVVTAVIDTLQYQRLRRVKQLGTAEYVYINTNHNRFEHSIGVAFLARKMISRVRHRQPQLPCDAKDELCIELAGLLHDIGHGPFSHVYESFIKHSHPAFLEENEHYSEYYKDEKDCTHQLPEVNVKKWKHEEGKFLYGTRLGFCGICPMLISSDVPVFYTPTASSRLCFFVWHLSCSIAQND